VSTIVLVCRWVVVTKVVAIIRTVRGVNAVAVT
jgi:hypothetical protein